MSPLSGLARLNDLYEKRFPGLAFVTYVAGRPRAAVADELEQLLGKEVTDSKVDPNAFPSKLVFKEESKQWHEEFTRGLDALWQIANDRASKMEAKSAEPAPSSAPSKADPATVQPPQSSADEKKEEAFISLATFRMLALSSPVLESFFEKDLGASFQLAPADRSESGGAFSWHSAPALPNSPRSIPGADRAAQSAGIANASYSKDVTTGARGKVIGFLGGLMGEEGKAKMNALADTVGQRLQTHTVSGPVPSFGRARTLDGTNMDTAELREKDEERKRTAAEERKATFGARLAGIVRKTSAAVPPLSSGESGAYSQVPGSASLQNTGMLPPDTPSRPAEEEAEDERGRSSSRDAARQAKRASMRATDISSAGPNAAVEALRQAATLERSHFTIDEIGAGNGVGMEDEEEGEEELSIAQEGAEAGSEGPKEGGRLEGKEAQLAKGEFDACASERWMNADVSLLGSLCKPDLRSAPVQQ